MKSGEQMKVTIVGNRIHLNDLEIGKIAVDKDSKVYTKVYVPDPNEQRTMFLRLDSLANQYNDMIRGDTIVRELSAGESVLIKI
jgi:hypothetical protein